MFRSGDEIRVFVTETNGVTVGFKEPAAWRQRHEVDDRSSRVRFHPGGNGPSGGRVHLVNVGDSEEVVLDKCGRPTSSIRRTAQWQWFTMTVDQWTYDLGPNQFARILTFDVTTNRLITILIGDYGK